MKTHKKESGVTLIETMTVVLLLMIMAAGMTAVFGFCTGTNKSQGDIATRTTELAQDKMEELMALNFGDANTDTTVFPAGVGGTGLGGAMAPSTTLGSTTQGAPVAGFVDYLDAKGNLLAGAAGAFYTRQWSITTNATGKLKTILVVTFASNTGGGPGVAASSPLVCLKSNTQ